MGGRGNTPFSGALCAKAALFRRREAAEKSGPLLPLLFFRKNKKTPAFLHGTEKDERRFLRNKRRADDIRARSAERFAAARGWTRPLLPQACPSAFRLYTWDARASHANELKSYGVCRCRRDSGLRSQEDLPGSSYTDGNRRGRTVFSALPMRKPLGRVAEGTARRFFGAGFNVVHEGDIGRTGGGLLPASNSPAVHEAPDCGGKRPASPVPRRRGPGAPPLPS